MCSTLPFNEERDEENEIECDNTKQGTGESEDVIVQHAEQGINRSDSSDGEGENGQDEHGQDKGQEYSTSNPQPEHVKNKKQVNKNVGPVFILL